ncbi:MAG: DUF6491 family protein [Arenimonas sp.]
MKKLIVLLAGLALAGSASCASAGGRTRIDYAAYAGDSVKEITYFQLYNWQRSTDKSVVLWTKPSAAYMLTLEHTCDSLRGSRVTIEVGGVAAIAGRLRTGDDLIVGPIKCRVSDIRPIDLAAIKRDRK